MSNITTTTHAGNDQHLTLCIAEAVTSPD